MISEVIVSRLDELIGDFDTPFFNYLLYSYDLALDECEQAVSRMKSDISDGKIQPDDNLVELTEEYFRAICIERQKREKMEYLSGLMSEDSDFYLRFLSSYDVSAKQRNVIRDKIIDKIIEDDIGEFEIRRSLEYYFLNATRQDSYIASLDRLIGNYDTLTISKIRRENPNIGYDDLAEIANGLYGEIIDGENFTSIKEAFSDRVMRRSEAKKADAIHKWESLVLGNGDSFNRLLELKNLSISDGEAIKSDVRNRILNGLITADKINGAFLTMLCIDYGKVHNEGK